MTCRDVHQLLFITFEWMDHLVVDAISAIFFTLCASFADCLAVGVLVVLGAYRYMYSNTIMVLARPSELEELTCISPWLPAADYNASEEFCLGITVVGLLHYAICLQACMFVGPYTHH